MLRCSCYSSLAGIALLLGALASGQHFVAVTPWHLSAVTPACTVSRAFAHPSAAETLAVYTLVIPVVRRAGAQRLLKEQEEGMRSSDVAGLVFRLSPE